jgi:hypothetical protein
MKSLIGKKYGHWTVIALARSLGKLQIYTIRCVCGKKKQRAQSRLAESNSCGCQNKTECAKRLTEEARDLGVRPPEPQWQPDFSGITKTVRRVAVNSFWEIKVGDQVIDRIPMSTNERRAYAR